MNAYEVAGAVALPSLDGGKMPRMTIRVKHPVRFALYSLLAVPIVCGLIYAYTTIFKTVLF